MPHVWVYIQEDTPIALRGLFQRQTTPVFSKVLAEPFQCKSLVARCGCLLLRGPPNRNTNVVLLLISCTNKGGTLKKDTPNVLFTLRRRELLIGITEAMVSGCPLSLFKDIEGWLDSGRL